MSAVGRGAIWVGPLGAQAPPNMFPLLIFSSFPFSPILLSSFPPFLIFPFSPFPFSSCPLFSYSSFPYSPLSPFSTILLSHIHPFLLFFFPPFPYSSFHLFSFPFSLCLLFPLIPYSSFSLFPFYFSPFPLLFFSFILFSSILLFSCSPITFCSFYPLPKRCTEPHQYWKANGAPVGNREQNEAAGYIKT